MLKRRLQLMQHLYRLCTMLPTFQYNRRHIQLKNILHNISRYIKLIKILNQFIPLIQTKTHSWKDKLLCLLWSLGFLLMWGLLDGKEGFLTLWEFGGERDSGMLALGGTGFARLGGWVYTDKCGLALVLLWTDLLLWCLLILWLLMIFLNYLFRPASLFRSTPTQRLSFRRISQRICWFLHTLLLPLTLLLLLILQLITTIILRLLMHLLFLIQHLPHLYLIPTTSCAIIQQQHRLLLWWLFLLLLHLHTLILLLLLLSLTLDLLSP